MFSRACKSYWHNKNGNYFDWAGGFHEKVLNISDISDLIITHVAELRP